MLMSNRIEHAKYIHKWETELEEKVEFRINKYGESLTEEEHAALTNIKWRDVDLDSVGKVEDSTNVIIIGDITPPLSEEEIEVIAMDPKYCMETNITIEDIKVSMAEAKVKRIWSEASKPVIEEGEEPPSEEEIRADQEIEDETRRIYWVLKLFLKYKIILPVLIPNPIAVISM